MANITYSSGAPWQGGAIRSALRRGQHGISTLMIGLKWELAAQRRHYLLERGLRDLDRRQLRDIGIDRNAC